VVVISHGYDNAIVNLKSEVDVQKTSNWAMILELVSVIDQNDLRLYHDC